MYQKTALPMQAAVDASVLFSAIAAELGEPCPRCAKACGGFAQGCARNAAATTGPVNGLLLKAGDKYSLTPEAATFLDKASPAYLGGVMGFLNGPIAPFLPLLSRVGAAATASPARVGRDGVRRLDPVRRADEGADDVPHGAGDRRATRAVQGRVLDVASGHGLFRRAGAEEPEREGSRRLDWPKVLDVAKSHAACARGRAVHGDPGRCDRVGLTRPVRRDPADGSAAPLQAWTNARRLLNAAPGRRLRLGRPARLTRSSSSPTKTASARPCRRRFRW